MRCSSLRSLPIAAQPRFSQPEHAVEFEGMKIPRNSAVLFGIAAANRDPEVFDGPDRFDIDRRPSELLTFGPGLRTCPGMHLAQKNLRVALRVLAAAPPTQARGRRAPRTQWHPAARPRFSSSALVVAELSLEPAVNLVRCVPLPQSRHDRSRFRRYRSDRFDFGVCADEAVSLRTGYSIARRIGYLVRLQCATGAQLRENPPGWENFSASRQAQMIQLHLNAICDQRNIRRRHLRWDGFAGTFWEPARLYIPQSTWKYLRAPSG